MSAAATSSTKKQRERHRQSSSDGGLHHNEKMYSLETYAPLVSCKWWELLAVDAAESQDEINGLARGARVFQALMASPARALSEMSCQKVYESYAQGFEALVRYDDQQKWLNKMIEVGTTSDRIAALVMKVQMAPLFAVSDLRALLKMAQKKSRNESSAACDALRDLFLELLPSDRKLLSLRQAIGTTTSMRSVSDSVSK